MLRLVDMAPIRPVAAERCPWHMTMTLTKNPVQKPKLQRRHRIKSLIGQSSSGFVEVRLAGQLDDAYASEQACTGANCN
jgi:hypothetical protein